MDQVEMPVDQFGKGTFRSGRHITAEQFGVCRNVSYLGHVHLSMPADRKTAQKKCSGSLGHPWFSGLSDRESPVCAQWSRRQPLSGFRPEVEHVSTTPKVTATTRVVGRVLLSGYGRWSSVLSRKSSIPNESSSFLRFSRLSIRESRVRSTWVTRRRGWLGSLP